MLPLARRHNPEELNLKHHHCESLKIHSLPYVSNIDVLHMTVFLFFATDVWSYVQQLRTLVEDLHGRMLKIKENADKIHALINTWSHAPLFKRKEGKKDNLMFLGNREEHVSKR
jgi:hypothetical protein